MIQVHRVEKSEWAGMAKNAHIAVFAETPDKPTIEKFDYVLLAMDTVSDTPLAYVTIQEQTDGRFYWAFGGSFPSARDSLKSWKSYTALTAACFENGAQVITTIISNDNDVMLKFAAKIGYRIIGTFHANTKTMLYHALPRELFLKLTTPGQATVPHTEV